LFSDALGLCPFGVGAYNHQQATTTERTHPWVSREGDERLTYMTDNNYIDSSVQKGGIPEFSGCVEHANALTQLLHEAIINHKILTVVWLDLTNSPDPLCDGNEPDSQSSRGDKRSADKRRNTSTIK